MQTDDKKRSKKGIVICLRDIGDGTSRIIFDDVIGDTQENPINWQFNCFYTWNYYDNKILNSMKLTDREYQEIGENIVARLLALNNRVK
jgi:hypothetical protein